MFYYKYCRSWNEYLLQPKPATITGLTLLQGVPTGKKKKEKSRDILRRAMTLKGCPH